MGPAYYCGSTENGPHYQLAETKSNNGTMTVLARSDGVDTSGSDALQQGISWAMESGIRNGTSSGTLNPYGTATRSQFARFLYRFWEQIG